MATHHLAVCRWEFDVVLVISYYEEPGLINYTGLFTNPGVGEDRLRYADDPQSYEYIYPWYECIMHGMISVCECHHGLHLFVPVLWADWDEREMYIYKRFFC